MRILRLPESAWTGLLLLFLCCIYPPEIIAERAAGQTFLKGDCVYYQAVVVSILQDHDLRIANNLQKIDNGQLALGQDGQLVPKHPILMPVVSLPFYLALGNYGLLLFNLVGSAVLMLLIFKLNRLFFDPLTSFITTVLYATGTLFLEYTNNYSPDVFSTVLVVGALYLVLVERHVVAALLLGLSIFAKVPNALPAALILAYASWVRPRVIAGMAVAFALALVPFLWVNNHLFGSPFVTGYQRTVVGDYAAGQATLLNHLSMFNQPFFTGLVRLFVHRSHGVLPTNPVMVASFFGVAWLRRMKQPAAAYLILAICASQFLFFAKYDEWNTSHFSNRFLMIAVALSSVFTANLLDVMRERFTDHHEDTKIHEEHEAL